MILGDYFVLTLMTLNLSASVAYAYHGLYWNALYWVAACTLNLCLLNLK